MAVEPRTESLLVFRSSFLPYLVGEDDPRGGDDIKHRVRRRPRVARRAYGHGRRGFFI